MTDETILTFARFAALAEAYGSRLERWPARWRDAAQTFAETPDGRAVLAEAAGVDALLDASALAPPGAALVGRIAAAAGRRLTLRRRLRRWGLGLGLLGVGLAGGVAGAAAMVAVTARPDPRWAVPAETLTAFGDIRADPDPMQDAP